CDEGGTRPRRASSSATQLVVVRLRYLGHSAVQLTSGEHEVVIDPFLTGNPKAAVSASELDPAHIVITHAHGDHWGDTPDIARRTGAAVVSNAEIAAHAERRGLTAHGMNTGGRHECAFGSVTFTIAFHSSSFSD